MRPMTEDNPTPYPCPSCSNPVIPDSPFCPHCGRSLQAHSGTLIQSGPASQPPEEVTPVTLIKPEDPGTRATIIQPRDPAQAATILQPSNPGAGATILKSPAHPVRLNPMDDAEMICIPPGEFIMGSNDGNQNERPKRTVYLDQYWIYRTPVTVAQYRMFCQAKRRKMPKAPSWGWKDDHPVVNVMWHDAAAYAEWVGAALPTEAQWEKAARGTDGRKFPWGNEWDPGKLQWSKKEPGDAGSTAPVGSFPRGASPYGAQDMTGNVWEWCADWYDKNYYERAPVNNPTGPASSPDMGRVLRGGSWRGNNQNLFRCALRFRYTPSYRGGNVGFRCVVRAVSR